MWFFSQSVGKSLYNFQGKISLVWKSIRLSFNDFDLTRLYLFGQVVNPFEFTGMNVVVTVINDSVAITLEHVSKFPYIRMIKCIRQKAPLIKCLYSPCP